MNKISSKKCGQISIIGKPNAGKSSLMNKIIGQKISIVTPKVQTTRSIITGIYTDSDTQLIFLDTPGIFNPSKALEKAMVRCAWSSIHGADLVCLLIDFYDFKLDDEFRGLMQNLSKQNLKPLIIFNKIDKIRKNHSNFEFIEKVKKENFILNIEKLLDISNSTSESDKPNILSNDLAEFKTFFPDSDFCFISVNESVNIDELVNFMKFRSPLSEWMYEEDEITTAPMKFLATEITRENLFYNLSHELPYNLKVEATSWEEIGENEFKIQQEIIVTRQSHKKIILGDAGAMIKKISMKSRTDISNSLGIKAHLFLFVKVREDWDKKQIYYHDMGLAKFFNDSKK